MCLFPILLGQSSAIQFFLQASEDSVIKTIIEKKYIYIFIYICFSVVIPAKASSSQASLKETMLGWSTLHSLGRLELSASTNHGQLPCWGLDDCNCFSTSPGSESTERNPRYAFRQISPSTMLETSWQNLENSGLPRHASVQVRILCDTSPIHRKTSISDRAPSKWFSWIYIIYIII